MTENSFAERLVKQATEAREAGRLQEAYKMLVSGAAAGDARAWYEHGNANADLGLWEAAAACEAKAYRLACEARDTDLALKAATNAAQYCYWTGEFKESEKWSDRAEAEALGTGRREDTAFACATSASVHLALDRFEAAETLARYALKMNDLPATRMTLAFALLRQRKWREGLEMYEARFPYKMQNYLHWPYPRWNGEKTATLVVAMEQGLGDSLQFARFLPLARERCEHLIVLTQPALIGYLAQRIKGVEWLPDKSPFPVADAWCPVMSLPLALGLSDDEISATPFPPWIYGDTGGERQPLLPLRVGICWAGDKNQLPDRYRSRKLTEFLTLASIDGVQLVSLQYGERARDIHDCGAAALVEDPMQRVGDVLDTAEIIRGLDLVVSVDTMVAHLAAIENRECWVIYGPGMARDWRWPGWKQVRRPWTCKETVYSEEHPEEDDEFYCRPPMLTVKRDLLEMVAEMREDEDEKNNAAAANEGSDVEPA